LKDRLDKVVFERGLAKSREAARGLILSGSVFVGDKKIDKAGAPVDRDAIITVASRPAYVSRGGVKLSGALDRFGITVAGWIAIDVGASTGGFTDCLLQRGAARVYAVDVGYGQLDYTLRQDPRVIVLDRQNIRHIKEGAIPEKADIITIDVSFISVELVIPALFPLLSERGEIVALIKPQFEVGKGSVGAGGIVRDPAQHQAVLDKISAKVREWEKEGGGIGVKEIVPSPITGKKGNQEFFIHITKQG
jgi:23S rRNA (cytidine1920-2'-O)/16S rRNA (cytidine1409-2'-O)-methyltransferase